MDSVGESSTQECGAYVFHPDENKAIRLIDTPGIGDTRGIEYDKKNFENILMCVSQYDYLNGICILLKPNNARLNIIFRYCIQELLSHLHKSAKDNIVFCFTNTRGTFFRPGDTFPVLKRQLQELKENFNIEIKICKDTIYCFDNESFRYLVAVKKGMIFTDNDKENFISSWEKSTEESVRLLQYITSCTPHIIINTISLNKARQTVMILCEPLAEVNRNIQENTAAIKRLKKEIQRDDLTDEELMNKLYFPCIELELELFDRPRVECTNNYCQKAVINKTVESCHVKWKKLNTFMLKRNGAMKFGKCKSCSCPAKNHKPIFYESKSKYSKKFYENKFPENKLGQIDKENHLKMLQEKIDQLKAQQDMVGNIVIQFTQFLIQNAIANFNDSYAEYLDYIIQLERRKFNASKDYNNEILEGLEEIKRKYDEKVKLIKKKIENGEHLSNSPSIEDIFRLEQQLYSLPDVEQYLRNVKKEEERTL
ncbi:24357_t:CDS:1, partial [Racocetra persica]